MKNIYLLSITAENALRVLQRITTVLAKHRVNIEQLTVFETRSKGISHFNIVIHVEENLANKLVKQLQRIVEVHAASVIPAANSVIPATNSVIPAYAGIQVCAS